jgi:hypothetical protein
MLQSGESATGALAGDNARLAGGAWWLCAGAKQKGGGAQARAGR